MRDEVCVGGYETVVIILIARICSEGTVGISHINPDIGTASGPTASVRKTEEDVVLEGMPRYRSVESENLVHVHKGVEAEMGSFFPSPLLDCGVRPTALLVPVTSLSERPYPGALRRCSTDQRIVMICGVPEYIVLVALDNELAIDLQP